MVFKQPLVSNLKPHCFYLDSSLKRSSNIPNWLSRIPTQYSLVNSELLFFINIQYTIRVCLHLLHFLDYFQFLYLLLHCLLHRLRVIHRHSFIPPEKDLQPVQNQQVIKFIFIGENGLRNIMVLNKKSMVLVHYTNGS